MRIPGLINYSTTQEHEMNSFGTVTWFVKVQWVVVQCHKWVKNSEKLQGQHKSDVILHTTYLGRLVLIEETPVGSANPNLKVHTSWVRLGEMGLAHLHQPGHTNSPGASKYPQVWRHF